MDFSKTLKEAGYTVAANFGGNEEAAAKFKSETGIPVYKFDVSDPAACEAGIRTIESELGPVDVLVNNACITRDGMFHRMTERRGGIEGRLDLAARRLDVGFEPFNRSMVRVG